MKSFPFDPSGGYKCPICGNSEVKDAILVPIAGTKEGSLAHAAQVHTNCLHSSLYYYPPKEFIGSLIVAESPFPFRKEQDDGVSYPDEP